MATHVPSSEGTVPEAPDTHTLHPTMRYEWLRTRTFMKLAFLPCRKGIFLTNVIKEGYFLSKNGWITCYDCGIMFDLGHRENCRANHCHIPFDSFATLRQVSEALEMSASSGLLKVRAGYTVAGDASLATTAVQPSCGSMDLSIPRPGRPHRQPRNRVEEAGFVFTKRNSVRCPGCQVEIAMDRLTALQTMPSLQYIQMEHARRSPGCPGYEQ